MDVKKWEIWTCDLSGKGSEQTGARPVLIIQNNKGNKFSQTTIIACITSKDKRKLPTHVRIYENENLDKESVIIFEQLMTIDKSRLHKKICTLPKKYMYDCINALMISVIN